MNLWIFFKIKDLLKQIEEKSGKTNDIIVLLCKLCDLIRLNIKKEVVIPYENIDYMQYSTINIDSNLNYLKDIVNEEGLVFYNVLLQNIKTSHDPYKSLIIVKRILENNYNKSKEIDNYDCLFIFLLKTLEQLPLSKKIKKYLIYAKDIFYYRLKKKDKELRVNLIYYSIFVLVSKNIEYEELQPNSNSYLFVVPKIDYQKQEEMELLRTQNKEEKIKKINVHDNLIGMDLKIILTN